MNILLTGSNGYLGKGISNYLFNKYNITSINRDIFDLNNNYATKKWFENKYYDVVIHTAIKGGNRLGSDSSDILDTNVKMYLNLLECKDHYSKFINIGSGAEILSPESFYGMSKKFINSSIIDKNGFYTLRIFAVFDENELERRFIKSNLTRYINKESLVVHKNRYMDFMYLGDFISILELYIKQDNLPKTIDCVYNKKYSLVDIANIINLLDDYAVNVNLLDIINDKDYIGTYTDLNIVFTGLEQGILNAYRKIKNEKDMVCS